MRRNEQVEILYNPYQGLKPDKIYPMLHYSKVEILYNPYQGLKQETRHPNYLQQ